MPISFASLDPESSLLHNQMNITDGSLSQPKPGESSEQVHGPVASAQASGAAANADLADGSRKHLLAPAASRSSSKVDKQSTLDKTQETVHDDSENTLRGSKRSILKGRRDRSRGSSRRSRRQNQDSASVENQKTPTGPEAPQPEKKKVSLRIFAFLSCCSSSNVDSDDTAIPAKKTVKRQSLSNRQPTPEKTEPTPADQSTTGPREQDQYREEKPNPTVTSNQSPTQVEEERDVALQEKDAQFNETAATSDQIQPDHGPATVQKDYDGQASTSAPRDAAPMPSPVLEKDESPAQKSEEHVQSPSVTWDQSVDDSPVADPSKAMAKPLAETDPKEEVQYYSHDEEAMGIPPPPPPMAPPSQEGIQQQWLLPPAVPPLQNRKCLVLDLDETLVHSSFKVLERADFTIPVEIEGQYHNIYVIKRPGVDQFMKRVGELYEVVVFTASVSKYGDPLLDQLDIHDVVHHRLFRDSCYNHQGNYVKDLSQIGRDIRETIIIDNSPTSYIFHPQHAIPISSWFSDAHDNELLDLIPVLEDLAGTQVQDVSLVLDISL